MASVAAGLLAMILGLVGLWVWRWDFARFLKGMIPLSLFLAGLIAIIAGLSHQRHHDRR